MTLHDLVNTKLSKEIGPERDEFSYNFPLENENQLRDFETLLESHDTYNNFVSKFFVIIFSYLWRENILFFTTTLEYKHSDKIFNYRIATFRHLL